METKMESDLIKVTTLTDSEYIRAVTEDGVSVLIKRNHLYPIATESTNGLMSTAIVKSVMYNKGNISNIDTFLAGIGLSSSIAGLSGTYVVEAIQFGGASTLQKATNILFPYEEYLRRTPDRGTTWDSWMKKS